MKIYINGRFLTENVTGVQQYAISVMKALDYSVEARKEFCNCEFVLLIPRNLQKTFVLKNISIEKVGFLSGDLWEQFELPFYSRCGTLINLCNRAPLFKLDQLLVIHDAAISATPDRFPIKFRLFWRGMYFIFGKTLKNIITVSFFSKTEICKYFRVNEAKVQVVYEGKEHILSKKPDFTILKKYGLEMGRFVLAVGGTKNKNFSILVKSMKFYMNQNVKIIIAGQVEEQFIKEIESFSSMQCVGYVSDEELVALYKNAECFIFPSIYEGFGIPPLEAMALGCPVIVANTASLPEVCGEAALYCDPYDAKDVADKIQLMLSDANMAEDLRKKGLIRIKKFSWDNTVKQILYILKNNLMRKL